MKVHRIGVFFAPPPDHPLWQAGSLWLGRDASRPSAHEPISSPVAESLVRAPRRYGFHATLKPPFQFDSNIDAERVWQQARCLASQLAPFEMPRLSVQWLDDFLALRPVNSADPAMTPLIGLAARVVRDLDPLRRPASQAELAKRRHAGLTAPQESMLVQWGYPYVLDTWRFHMTLTGPVSALPESAAVKSEILEQARGFFEASLREPLHCEHICLFVEPEPGAELIIWRRLELTGRNSGL